ncbi:hypothetical protein, variant [Capsaspora owczarzaki ATCC 30864]|uniref:Uncharacterized protein n=1 Tax=Capsaspora owczarzaki (strain ATCC 30864) TaxID=595528 RepID=E9CAB4_CAPO3|nr:hypothetical protein CAOG_05350 [Capsaspora owczarzaki ATCC 30864]XP_011270496.1 hypothetical protein, variant [Capsaspora owczarzaki ATCC 30864]KJE94762.1 hypothetical protein CAOG_005350 [Capsaspora owczarzaki ATCC 30864]|eukprot:XP_004347035.2 hypothetical protein CAOG_05350 [Capsaspora owczarzaki ATCC 30864]
MLKTTRTMRARAACAFIALVLMAGIARAGPGTLRLTFYGVNGNDDCDGWLQKCDFQVQSIFAYTTTSGTTTNKVGLPEKGNDDSPRWNYAFPATVFPTFSGSITFSIDLIENDSGLNGDNDDYGAVTYNVAVTAGAAAKDVTLGGFWYVTNVYINVQFTCSPDYYGNTCDTQCSTNSGNCNNCNSAGACTSCATGYTGTVWPCTLTPNWCTIPGTAVGAGTRNCANTINGVCTTSCNTGYTLSPGTAASTTCLSSRAWSSGNPGVCVVNNNYCTAKAAPANGQMSCTNFFALNSVCSFSCNNVGFTFAGASSLTCNSNTQASGSWSAGTDATCTLITNFCPTLPITNGVTSYSTLDQRLGSVASFTCNTGYTISDASRTATCQTGKTWSNSAPTCTATPGWCAPSAVNPSNGNVLCSASDTISSTCTYSCNNGYDLGGAASTQCQSSRSWSAAPWTTCQPKSPYCLQPPTPQFASASTCTRTIGGTCTFLCNNGYTQTSGDLSLTCASGSVSQGTWNGNSVVCGLKPAYCPTISSIANGAISSYTTTLGSVATFSCQPGFILTGATSTMCSALNAANGQWSNANPTCVYDEAYCPVPATYSHGTASCGATPRRIGTTCTYACDLGYITAPSTPASAICASGATWSSTPAAAPDCVENLAFCPDSQSADAHGSVSCSNSRARGSTCTAQCNAGYQLVGDQTTTCLDSAAWSKPRPACAIIDNYCGAAPIAPNGRTDCTGSGIGTVCTFNCNDGFQRASGAATTACQTNTQWSVATATACTLITNYCPALTAPTNGLIQAGCSRSITSQCSFACSSGFILTGATTIACQGGATWTQPAPTCTAVSNFCASSLVAPADGTMNCAGSAQVGDTCTFSCNVGFALSGQATSTCTSLGSYSSVAPLCLPIEEYCTGNSFPTNVASVSCSRRNTISSTCTYACALGYSIVGGVPASSISCNANNATRGVWSGAVPQCAAVPFCPALATPTNGTMSCSSTNTINSVCTFTCGLGFVMNGGSSTQCTSTGLWSSSVPSCQAIEHYCNAAAILAPEHGSVLCSIRDTVGSSCAFGCDPGYGLSHTNQLQCAAVSSLSGSWSTTAPTCSLLPNYCSTLSSPANGALTCDKGSSLGSVCTTSCMPGFLVSNSSLPLCTVDTTWSSSQPVCAACPSCSGNGVCALDGVTQTAYCICNSGFTGPNCNQCISGRYGPTCAFCPSCQNGGICNDTISGNGFCTCTGSFTGTLCTQCLPGFWGASCSACPACQRGVCSDSVTGSGQCVCQEGASGALCDECAPNYYGPTCTSCPLCYSGTCADGVSGNGTCVCDEGFTGGACDNCVPGHYGVSCTACPACVHGTCRDGMTRDGACVCDANYGGALCDDCIPGRFGASCTACPSCYSGTCNDGLAGDGLCSCPAGFAAGACDTCLSDHYGRNCTACPHCDSPSTCNSGYSGDGSCVCAGGYAGASCQNCASGRYGPTCLPCPACLHGACNETKTGNGQCICSTGFTGANCQLCQSGYFGSSCTACPNCHTGSCDDGISGSGVCSCPSPFTGANCTDCQRGYYLSGASCVACESGNYCVNNIKYTCQPGSYQPSTGQSECSACSIGTAQSASGRTSCSACPNGQFQNLPGQANCTLCESGSFAVSSVGGTASCSKCLPGTFAAGLGNSDCDPCGSGLYQASYGKGTCDLCNPGEVPGNGARSCVPCAPGTNLTVPGAASCSGCPMGYAQPDQGATTCLPCGPGYEARTTGKANCDPCSAGSFSTGLSNTACSVCAADSYQDETGKTSCKSCPGSSSTLGVSGATSVAQCVCAPGYRWDGALSVCSPCEMGSRCVNGIQTACTAGTYQPNTTRSTCEPCPAGSISTSPGAVMCTGCGSSQYQPLPGKTSCQSCPQRSSHSSTHETSVSACVCQVGYSLNTNLLQCVGINCHNPIPTAGMFANCSAGTLFPATCRVSCVAGFDTNYDMPTNTSSISCTVFGNWTRYPLHCSVSDDSNQLVFGPDGQLSVAAIAAIAVVLILVALLLALVLYRKKRYGHVWTDGLSFRGLDPKNVIRIKGGGYIPQAKSSTSILGNKVFLSEDDIKQMPAHIQATLNGNTESGEMYNNPIFEDPQLEDPQTQLEKAMEAGYEPEPFALASGSFSFAGQRFSSIRM